MLKVVLADVARNGAGVFVKCLNLDFECLVTSVLEY